MRIRTISEFEFRKWFSCYKDLFHDGFRETLHAITSRLDAQASNTTPFTLVSLTRSRSVRVRFQGKVHNPTGEGVRPFSTQVKAKVQKIKDYKDKEAQDGEGDPLETKVKEVGTARRNIHRKKSGASEGTYDSRNKKQGGHGKGQWKLDGTVMDEYAGEPLNEDDPLYDETVEGRYILSSGDMTDQPVGFHEQDGKAIYGPMLTLPEFKIRLGEAIREYFDSADSDEVIRSIEELKCRAYHPEVVKRAVSLSLDEGPRERELVSRLLTCLHPTPLSEEDMEDGFELLLLGLEELSIDCPDAQVRLDCVIVQSCDHGIRRQCFRSRSTNSTSSSRPVNDRMLPCSCSS
jgi:hypothetical protein